MSEEEIALKREWLRRYRVEEWKRKRLAAELENLIDTATSISPVLSGMPHSSGVSDKVGLSAQRISDKRTELELQAIKCDTVRSEIIASFNQFTSERVRTIFTMKFINGMTDDQIGEAVYMEGRHVRRLIRSGLAHLVLLCPN